MREFFQRHRTKIVTFGALMLPLFLLYVHGRHPRKTTVIEKGLMQVTGPAQAAAETMISGLSDVWSGYVALIDVKEENERLEEQVSVLTGEALRAKELEMENERLRELLKFKRARKDLQTISAHVIGKDVSPYARVVRVAIDVGEGDGVLEDMPVVSREGLVGRVSHIAGRYAEVMLVADARSSVSVKVAGKGVTGAMEGTGTGNDYTARLLFLHKAQPLEVNDTLVTSGHDKIFPAGIEVGYILSLDERQRDVYYEVEVAPAVNFSTLEEVMVVTGTVDAVADSGKPGEDEEGAPR